MMNNMGNRECKADVTNNKTRSLELIDYLVYYKLNPLKDIGVCSLKEKQEILQQIEKEVLQIRVSILDSIVASSNINDSRCSVRNYHIALTSILSQSYSNFENIIKDCLTRRTIFALNRHLEDLVSEIEFRYSSYLSMSETVPRSYFRKAQEEISFKLKKLQQINHLDDKEKAIYQIIMRSFARFIDSNEFESKTSYSAINYKSKLLSELQKIDTIKSTTQFFTQIDATLILLNYNSREYINNLLIRIEDKISMKRTCEEKASETLYLNKLFKQLPKNPDIAYNPSFYSIDRFISDWFSHELLYIERIFNIKERDEPSELNKQTRSNLKSTGKVVCMLSTDQIGVIIRAAADTKIIVSKSVNEIFKTVVPSISTAIKEDLSYDAMRSKSYSVEDRDKKIVVEVLEKMNEKIKDY